MKILVVDDDFTSRYLLHELLKGYGHVYIAVDGEEAVTAFGDALSNKEPFDLVCLDIMMPKMNGQTALIKIREKETDQGILSTEGAKIIMTTALHDIYNLSKSFGNLVDGYMSKPIYGNKLTELLDSLNIKKQE